MKCSLCGGPVEWQDNGNHTECLDCGETDCQETDPVERDDPRDLEGDYRMDEMEDRRLHPEDEP